MKRKTTRKTKRKTARKSGGIAKFSRLVKSNAGYRAAVKAFNKAEARKRKAHKKAVAIAKRKMKRSR